MTTEQFAREQLRLAREKERRILARGWSHADASYVRDVVDWIWPRLLERKLRTRDTLRFRERIRLTTLAQLYSCSTPSPSTNAPAASLDFSLST